MLAPDCWYYASKFDAVYIPLVIPLLVPLQCSMKSEKKSESRVGWVARMAKTLDVLEYTSRMWPKVKSDCL